MPVELSAFSGLTTSSGVELSWRTSSEKENAGFSLLRAESGSANAPVVIASYESVTELRGQGTTASASNYGFTDATVEAGKTYRYSIRSHDRSGTIHDYAQSVEVAVTEAVRPKVYDYALAQNYPNPFNPATVIRFTMKTAGAATLTVFDMLGRTVTEQRISARQGDNQYRFDATGLGSGTYFYRLQVRSSGSQAESFSQTKRMVLVK